MHNIAPAHWVRSIHIFTRVKRVLSSFSFHHSMCCHSYTSIHLHSACLLPKHITSPPTFTNIIHMSVWQLWSCLTQQFNSYVCIFLKYLGPSHFFNSSLTSRINLIGFADSRFDPQLSTCGRHKWWLDVLIFFQELRNHCFWDSRQMLKT
jgi:hypothetical protein